MVDKEFNDWAREFEKDWQNSDAYASLANCNKGLGKELFAYYIQYKSQEKIAKLTKKLVIGTWLLAIATIILALITFVKSR